MRKPCYRTPDRKSEADTTRAEATEPTVEVPLDGGTANAGLVVRVGDTVRRPQTPTSSARHALLLHLEKVGFEGAPRYLGEDDLGREMLSFIPGDAAITPAPSWALTDAALRSVADLLRDLHRAVRDFDPAGHAWGSMVPARFRSDRIGHNDPNLDNVVFRNGRAVALIDFDLASPGSIVWDVAIAARLWAPLRSPSDITDQRRRDFLRRFRLFVDACGLSASERDAVVDAVVECHNWCYDTVQAGALRGQAGYVGYWTPSAQVRDQRGRRWLASHIDLLRAALT